MFHDRDTPFIEAVAWMGLPVSFDRPRSVAIAKKSCACSQNLSQEKKTPLKSLTYRLIIGLAGLGIFHALGMLSANELAKTAVLMSAGIIGLAGLPLLGKLELRWLSIASVAIYLMFFLDAAIKGFLRDYFGLRPNPALVLQAVLNTNSGETGEFFQQYWRNVAVALTVFIAVALLAVLIERWLAQRESRTGLAPAGRVTRIAIVTMLFLFIALHFNRTMARENPALFWPLRYLEYQSKLIAAASMQQQISASMAPPSEWQVQYVGEAQRTVVWVIGESVNRSNMSLYGYARRTTPELDAMRSDLTVFRDVVSSEPATMPSLMKMLTPASLADPDAWSSRPDVLALAKAAGYKTFWLSNQVPNDGWLGLVAGQAEVRSFINKGAGRGENSFDGGLLPDLATALADRAPRKLIVVHLLGAHPTYDMRYPEKFARFDGREDAVAEDLQRAGRNKWIRMMRDEYDNAILYGDHVLAGMIRSTVSGAAQGGAALLFCADHGQEVGHTRNHAGQSVVDKSGYEVPLIVWQRNPGGRAPQLTSALESRPYQTDRLDHTLLGLLKIRSSYYDARDDLFDERFVARQRKINGRTYTPDR